MQQQPRLPLWFLVVNWALILSAFIIGTYLGRHNHATLPEPQQSAFELVFGEVLKSHIEPPNEHELMERAIAGMVDSLDKYSHYYPPADVPRYDESSSGHYEGIGAKIVTHEDQIVVHYPFPKGPAAAAGLLPGDILRAVDGTSLADPEVRAKAVELVRGPADSIVTLLVDRNGNAIEIKIRRGSMERPCVKWAHYLDPEQGLGYLHLTGFFPTASSEITHAIQSLEQDGNLRGLILDLRFNGGGSLDECLSIARRFLPTGIIATQKRRNAEDVVYDTIAAECLWPNLPLVLLINENSASASEVLAGALQDHQRANIVGIRSYGKGYVNTVYSWGEYKFKLKLSTGSYRTPNGRNIERNLTTKVTEANKDEGGIAPDVEAKLTAQQQQVCYQLLQEAIEPPPQFRAGYAKVAERYGFAVEQPPQATADPQLAAAIAALQKRIDAK
jgi:carboxyl-terminal processing protease